jgi:hypothetical protein
MLGVSTCNAAAVARLPALLLLALLLAGGADAALSKGPKVSPGRHICHSIDSTLPLTAVDCRCLSFLMDLHSNLAVIAVIFSLPK